MKNEKFLITLAQKGFVKLPTRKKQKYLNIVKESFSQSVALADVKKKKSTELERKWTHETGHVKHLVNPHRGYPIFKNLILDDHIRLALQKLFPNKCVYMTHSKLSFKAAGLNQKWLPHQDSAYKLRGASGLTVAIFLERCHVGNGTIHVYPGSHLMGTLKHKIVFAEGEREPQIMIKKMPNITPVPISGDLGDVFFFNLDTIHSSGDNIVGGLRPILIFEVEEARKYPLESDGRDAIYWNFLSTEFKKPITLPMRRYYLLLVNKLLMPFLKRIFFVFKSKKAN
jgi:ectoine hydroxylase-related dioxygenase (phytanoyl-CoA dioxygenase family)